MLYEILLVISTLYLIVIVTFAIAVANAHYSSDSSFRPSVSIVIAARNEEDNIRRCLESITNLTYPKNLLEIVVVDDRSTDRTQSIVSEFAARYPHIKLAASDPERGHLKGKTNAVTKGIELSTGEILLFTDADCTVKSDWVEQTVKYYDSQEIGIVAGFTSLRSRGWFESMQALDWFLLFSVAAGAIRMNFPVTAIGNNLSIRRKAYDAVGGYRQIPFSVTEDYALFHAIMSQTTFKARFPLDANTLVESNPCKSWGELYRQKMRWFTGGRDMELKSMPIFAVAYCLNVLAVALSIIDGPLTVLMPLCLKLVADLLLLFPSLSRFKRLNLILYFLQYQLYYITYVILFPFLLLFGPKVLWKDRLFAEAAGQQIKMPS